MNSKRQAARAMRRQGKSYGEIAKQLHVAKSTLSLWLKDVRLSRKQRSLFYTDRIKRLAEGPRGARARRQKEVALIMAQAKDQIPDKMSVDTYRLLGAGLYWAEGTKRDMMEITNSDPVLIYFMVHWFAHMFDVDPKTFKARLNIYAQQNDVELKRFWSGLCGIPVTRFGKSYVKPPSKNVKSNNLYYGTIKITVPRSSDMKWRIFGWIQAALGHQNEGISNHLRRWENVRTVERPVNLR